VENTFNNKRRKKVLLSGILLCFTYLSHGQVKRLSNFTEIIPEEHTRIVTSSPGKVFAYNAQEYVVFLSGATGYWKNNSEPHISSANALVHIKNGEVQSPQIKVFNPPRDFYTCLDLVFNPESYKERSFIQIRSACNEVKFDRFFLKHASNAFQASPQQSIHLAGKNVLHSSILKHGDEAYVLLVETPEIKPTGEVNRGGLGSDTLSLVRLDFARQTFDTISTFLLPARPFQDHKDFFGQVKINNDFTKVYLKPNIYDSLFTFSMGNISPEIKPFSYTYFATLDDYNFFSSPTYSQDSTFYESYDLISYQFRDGLVLKDSTVLKLPNRRIPAWHYTSINLLGKNQDTVLYSKTGLRDGEYTHEGMILADLEGNIIWEKQLTPYYIGLNINSAQYINDTILISGHYRPGRFVKDRETGDLRYITYGSRRSVCLRILADGTNLDAEALSKSEEVVVYPNPFYVDFKIAEEGVNKYQILDFNGNLVAEEILNPTTGIYRVYLPELDFGMYFLRLYKDDGDILEKKIFKMTY
tara:strand:+ start:580 stop:2163 length:1584 start_codon:yes stop_codon:yes gene_type:complete